jgi:hypothetical protein
VSTTRTDWDINLILTFSEDPNDGGYYLFYEHVDYQLEPGSYVYRSGDSAAGFSLFYTQSGSPIPSGTYYMSLWVDDQGLEQESNEINNLSVGNSQVTLTNDSYRPSGATQQESLKKIASDSSSGMRALAFDGRGEAIRHSFNGRRIPDTGVLMRKVRIADQADGTRTLILMDDDKPVSAQQTGVMSGEKKYNKVIHAADQAVFPHSNRLKVPIAQDVSNAK